VTPKNARVFRVVLAFWLFGWFCNSPGFLTNFIDALRFPIAYDAFPGVLRSPALALSVYLAPVLAIPALAVRSRFLARATSALLAALALVACLHLETCNDATFVTSFWSSLFLAWLAFNGERTDPAALLHGRALAQSIVGLMFLGAAVGKLTPEYPSGEAFYGLYFRDNDAFPYTWMKQNLDPDTVRGVAMWFSRFAISAELVLAAAPLLPTRFVLAGAALTMLSMMLAWTFHLASVVSCLFGLLVAAYMLRDDEASAGGGGAMTNEDGSVSPISRFPSRK
jgi:hypothetical protein